MSGNGKDLVLAKLAAIKLEVDKVKTIPDAKKYRDQVEAIESYVKRQDTAMLSSNELVKVRLDLERKLGQLLDEQFPRRAGPGRGKKRCTEYTSFKTIEDLGINKNQSANWRIIGRLPQTKYESAFDDAQKSKKEVSTKGVVKLAKDMARSEKESRRRCARLEAAKGVDLDHRIILGDFRQHADRVPDGSLSLIFTDPPYDKKSEDLFSGLGDFAAKKLSEGGSLLFYCGHVQLLAALTEVSRHLRFWWPCACIHSGGKALMREYGIRVGWKPILWFVKKTREDKANVVGDVVTGQTEKDHHDWQQAESEAAYWIDRLCQKDGIVCDPFFGSGTTGVAALKLNRQWVAFEIDPDTAARATTRISKCSAA